MKRIAAIFLAFGLLALPCLAAEATVQSVDIGGTPVELSMYTVYNEWGFATNYVKLRDVGWCLRDTAKRFQVDYDGSTRVDTGLDYQSDGTEMTALAAGAAAVNYRAVVTVDGVGHPLDAYLITPPGSDAGNFYFKLRDLGAAIGFGVGWSPERGVYIETE